MEFSQKRNYFGSISTRWEKSHGFVVSCEKEKNWKHIEGENVPYQGLFSRWTISSLGKLARRLFFTSNYFFEDSNSRGFDFASVGNSAGLELCPREQWYVTDGKSAL